MPRPTEADLCRCLVANLDESWEVYQEVQVAAGGRVADLVMEKGGLLWVVEVKCQLSWQLLDQALDWFPSAHLVSIATPPRRGGMRSGRRAIEYVLRQMGLGWLVVQPDATNSRSWRQQVQQRVRGRYHRPYRPNARRLADALTPERQTWCEAGTPGGGQYTPFKATCAGLAGYVADHPGVSLRDAFRQIRHHYASLNSACGAMRTWLLEDKVAGVRLEYDGRTPRLYPDTDPPLPGQRRT